MDRMKLFMYENYAMLESVAYLVMAMIVIAL
jgi:hypothetical protein